MSETAQSQWQRVTRRRRCPICERADWCLFAGDPQDPQVVICARTASPKRCGEAGWLHRLRDHAGWRHVTYQRRTIPLSEPKMAKADWSDLASRYAAQVSPDALDALAGGLGLTLASLRRLSIGWADRWRCWTFPLRDAKGNVVGITRRFDDGSKRMIAGGRVGLYMPDGLEAGGMLLVAEGATDCAAMLDLGFAAIGRFSCSTCIRHTMDLITRLRPDQLVIVADQDPVGRRGAEALASALLAYVPRLRVITPPDGVKDARAWRRAGTSIGDVMRVIQAAPVRRLSVTCQAKGVSHDR